MLCILELKEHQLTPNDITTVISTHGHSDHIGNNNLFLNAQHIVGQCVSSANKYIYHDFAQPFVINDSISVIGTTGHTLTCVSVIVRNTNMGKCVAIVGDLFECYEDIENDSIWLEAGSENPTAQKKNRAIVGNLSDVIIPGHGKLFVVTQEARDKLSRDSDETINMGK